MERMQQSFTHEVESLKSRQKEKEQEILRLIRQVKLKEDGIVGLQAANDNLKQKCNFVEDELSTKLGLIGELEEDINYKTA